MPPVRTVHRGTLAAAPARHPPTQTQTPPCSSWPRICGGKRTTAMIMAAYGVAAKAKISHTTTPNDHTSPLLVNTPSRRHCRDERRTVGWHRDLGGDPAHRHHHLARLAVVCRGKPGKQARRRTVLVVHVAAHAEVCNLDGQIGGHQAVAAGTLSIHALSRHTRTGRRGRGARSAWS